MTFLPTHCIVQCLSAAPQYWQGRTKAPTSAQSYVLSHSWYNVQAPSTLTLIFYRDLSDWLSWGVYEGRPCYRSQTNWFPWLEWSGELGAQPVSGVLSLWELTMFSLLPLLSLAAASILPGRMECPEGYTLLPHNDTCQRYIKSPEVSFTTTPVISSGFHLKATFSMLSNPYSFPFNV